MKKPLTYIRLIFVIMFFFPLQLLSQNVEPIYSGTFTRIKCPGPGMTFTEGLPLRILADGIDIEGWQWLESQMEAKKVEFYIDGVLHDTDNYLTGYNHFETLIQGLSIGTHTLTTKSYNYGGVVKTSPFPVVINIAPMPVKPNTIHLSGDINLTGTTNLDWQNAIVYGHGYKVTSGPGWSGNIHIQNSFITGLAVTHDSIPTPSIVTDPGIDVSTSGEVLIENSIFEWSGANYFNVTGNGNITVRKNEFRANAFIAYIPYDPEYSPIIKFTGNSSGTKVFQGNNVGAGHLYINYMSSWLIGGDVDSLTNIFIGPRTGIRVDNSSDITIRGNYSRHDYYGGWSQGFNFWFYNNSVPFLCEHNVIRQSSWPVQSLTGIFRYNLVVVAGHEWIRAIDSNSEIYRNILINPEPAGYLLAGCWVAYNQNNIKFYNNTFDGGGPDMDMFNSAIGISDGSEVSVLRNNVFTNFVPDASIGIVDRYQGETDPNHRIGYTDYNCFYNPDAGGANNYGDNLVNGITEGSPGFGANDLGGVNGQVNPVFNQGMTIPYHIEEDRIWNRWDQLSCVLADFRVRYTPQNSSPLIDAGDPLSGSGVDIGAVESASGTQQPDDLFGIFGCPNVNIENPGIVKNKFYLRAIPNPFHGSCQIEYELPISSQVELSVYNINGKPITSLMSGYMEKGKYNMHWDPSFIEAGIYVVKLTVGNEMKTIKLVLLE